ncbi:uncharacterized protein LOC144914453 [Branchiostoma floridae x Branchiostoma belcheri]
MATKTTDQRIHLDQRYIAVRSGAAFDNNTCEALSHCDWCEELDVPVCRETCLKTTSKPETVTGKPDKTTISPMNFGANTPDPSVPGPPIDCTTLPAGMYPDPQDCTMFYMCTGDPNLPQPVHLPCAPGTLFDWNLSVCTLTATCYTLFLIIQPSV